MANPFTAKQASYGNALAPGEWEMQGQQIMRQRKLAEALQQQADDPLQGQMVSGIYVAPSWTQGAAKLAKALSGKYQMAKADEQEKALAQQQREQQAADMGKFMETMQGKPAYTTQADTDEHGVPIPQRTIPAVPGDLNAALRVGMQSSNPMLQQFAMQQMLAGMKPKDNPFGKVDPKDFTAESVAKFAASGNYADLMPVRKMELAPSGVAYNPYGVAPGTVFNDPNKLIAIGAGGQPEVNQALVGVKKDIAHAGKTTVSVNQKVENKAAENIAGQVGGILKDSASAAEGAARTKDAAARIVSAVDSGKLISGPFANIRLSAKQGAELLGVGGRDNAEIIRNTREAIRGLAEMTLQGRKQMSGQGAITESESKLAEKAVSGDITDLTPAEVKQLAKASARAADWQMASHGKKLEAARKLPGAEAIVPFYESASAPDMDVPPAGAVRIKGK